MKGILNLDYFGDHPDLSITEWSVLSYDSSETSLIMVGPGKPQDSEQFAIRVKGPGKT